MKKTKQRLAEVLDRLGGTLRSARSGWPDRSVQNDLVCELRVSSDGCVCLKGYEALKLNVGTKPERILAAPKTKLAKLMRLGGIVPELRAERLKIIARMLNDKFGGDLRGALEKLLQGTEDSPGKGIQNAKNALKQFPVIGEPGADKILLFGSMAPVAAVPSAFVCVPQRILSGKNIRTMPRVTMLHRRRWELNCQQRLRRGKERTFC